jgi:RNA 2',3'-cyclic 3'-phosphodiesterase
MVMDRRRRFTRDRGPPAGSFAPWPDESDKPGQRARRGSLLACEAQLDCVEHWSAAHFVGALPAEPPAPGLSLAGGLQDWLAASGFASDLKPFRPHVTVVRKVSRPGRIEAIDALVWSFTELALIESRTRPEGPIYSVLESYSLCGADKSANNSETP